MEQIKTYAIIGGSSGIGFATAQQLIARGDRVYIGGRDPARLQGALDRLGPRATGQVVDTGDRAALADFFAAAPQLVGLFTPAASYQTGAFRDGDPASSEGLFAAKFWGQYWATLAALPALREDAAVVLMSGAASARPIGAPAYAACNAALEGLARGLAIELAPLRVNCLSPGTTDSDLWRNRAEDIRNSAYMAWAGMTVQGRPATVQEQAHAAIFLLDNTHMTGSTLYCDGGYTLR